MKPLFPLFLVLFFGFGFCRSVSSAFASDSSILKSVEISCEDTEADQQIREIDKDEAVDPYRLRYTIPEGRDAEELLEYAKKTVREYKVPENLTAEELKKEVVRQAEFLVAVAESALALKPKDPIVVDACLMKFQGLQHLARSEPVPDRIGVLEAYLDEMDRTIPDPGKAKLARVVDLQRRIDYFYEKARTEEEFRRIKQVILQLIEKPPLNFPPALPLTLLEFSRMAEEELGIEGLRESTAGELIRLLNASADEGLRESARQVEEIARLYGRECFLEGITVDNEKFNVKRYRGKVVLVVFFATWCGPCIQEFPHLKAVHAKYKDRGFEIVGVGGDETAKVGKMVDDFRIPWVVLSEESTVKAKLPSLLGRYGVKAYPTAFLLDAKGRIVNTNARGIALERSLAKLLNDDKIESSKAGSSKKPR